MHRFSSKISSSSSTDLNTFLPGNAEAAQVNKQLETFYGHKAIPLVIVFEKSSGILSSDEMTSIKAVSNKLSGANGIVRELTPPTESEDEKAAILVVPLASDGDFKSIFKDLKSRITDAKLPVTATFTGPASFAHDLQGAFSGIDGTLLIVAVSVVLHTTRSIGIISVDDRHDRILWITATRQGFFQNLPVCSTAAPICGCNSCSIPIEICVPVGHLAEHALNDRFTVKRRTKQYIAIFVGDYAIIARLLCLVG